MIPGQMINILCREHNAELVRAGHDVVRSALILGEVWFLCRFPEPGIAFCCWFKQGVQGAVAWEIFVMDPEGVLSKINEAAANRARVN